jgi:hypothetical protein
MALDPQWKRIVSGMCGIGILIAVLLLIRNGGISGVTLGQWQEALVFGAAAAWGVLWIVKRRQQREK